MHKRWKTEGGFELLKQEPGHNPEDIDSDQQETISRSFG